jgi:hypothetical protein
LSNWTPTRNSLVAAQFFRRTTSLETTRQVLKLSRNSSSTRVIAFGDPTLLSQLRFRPMVAMGWSSAVSFREWVSGLLEYLTASGLGPVTLAEAAQRL